jgi:hypothetical protein
LILFVPVVGQLTQLFNPEPQATAWPKAVARGSGLNKVADLSDQIIRLQTWFCQWRARSLPTQQRQQTCPSENQPCEFTAYPPR